jgi:hypothetical protein
LPNCHFGFHVTHLEQTLEPELGSLHSPGSLGHKGLLPQPVHRYLLLLGKHEPDSSLDTVLGAQVTWRDLRSEVQRQAHKGLSRFTVGGCSQLALIDLNLQGTMLGLFLLIKFSSYNGIFPWSSFSDFHC